MNVSGLLLPILNKEGGSLIARREKLNIN